MQKEAVAAYCKVLLQDLPGITEKKSHIISVRMAVLGTESLTQNLRNTGGHAVTQLVEALRYKPEGCGFDSRWYHWNFSLA
jgi:hypothetical protein